MIILWNLIKFRFPQLFKILRSLPLFFSLKETLVKLVILFLTILRMDFRNVSSQSTAWMKSLVAYVTLVNPFQFHGFDNRALIVNLDDLGEEKGLGKKWLLVKMRLMGKDQIVWQCDLLNVFVVEQFWLGLEIEVFGHEHLIHLYLFHKFSQSSWCTF